MQVVYLVGSSMVYLTRDCRFYLVFGSTLFTDCSLFYVLVGPGKVYGPTRISRTGLLLSLAGAPLADVAARPLGVGRFALQPTSTTLQATNTRPVEAREFTGQERRRAVPVR